MARMSWKQRAVHGAAAGAAATTAMSAVMLGTERAGLVRKPPPERIVEAGLDAGGIRRTETEENAAATVAHYGYGIANGAVFGVLAPYLPLPRSWRGPVFALALLALSYEGWVPLARIMRPLHSQRAPAFASLVGTHLVYGVVLGRMGQ
jgi:Family of unknown function (DUF6789)